MFRKFTLGSVTAAALIAASSSAFASSIVDVAKEAGTFNTLVAAVTAADLADTLSGDGPFTVFAPTDAAFAALPEGTVENLLKPENKADLIALLTYHVVAGKVMSTDLTNGMTPETVNGKTLTIMTKDSVKVDNAFVVTADIAADNGIIHVIDSVMLPK